MATTKLTALITLIALTTIHHSGEVFEEGDELKVDEKSAAQLVASGSAATPNVAAAQDAAGKKAAAAAKAREKAEAEEAAAAQAQADADARAKAEAEAAAQLVADAADGKGAKKPGKT